MAAVTTTDMDGFFLEQHGKEKLPLTAISKIQEMIKFESGKKLGRVFEFPVTLQYPDGSTYIGNANANYGTGYNLNTFLAGVSDEAKVLGRELHERGQIANGALSRSAGSAQAYKAALEYNFNLSVMAQRYKSEAEHLYGGGIVSDAMSGIGQVESVTYAGGGATTISFVIKAASWSAGIWNMAMGQRVDVWDTDLNPKVTATTPITITGVTASTRTITASGTAADLANMAADDLLFFNGWQSSSTVCNTHFGLYYHLANTGTIHDISATTYPLWQSQSVSNNSKPLTPKSIFNAIALTSTRCNMPRSYKVLCSSFAWADVNNNLSGWKQFGENTSEEMRIGTKNIGLDTAMVEGDIALIHHPMIKAGHAMVIADETWRRVGSTELRLGVPGAGGANEKFYIQGVAGVEFLLFSDYGLVNTEPNTACLITDIVNNELP